MSSTEFAAGPNQTFVVYSPTDTGRQVDPSAVFGDIAADAGSRAADGWHIVSTAVVPIRHAGVFMTGGSGYETQMSVVVVYARA